MSLTQGFYGTMSAGTRRDRPAVAGMHRPTRGRAEIFGIDAWRQAVAAHRRVAYVAGEPFLWPGLTAAETLEFIARIRGGDDRAYRDVLIERFRLDADKRVRALSKGNRQKGQLVAAFASRADLLILDEPTRGLDPLMEVLFLGIAALGFAIAPRASAAIGYGLVSVTFLWELVGPALGSPDWTLAVSPFHRIGLVPAQGFEAGAAVAMAAFGVAAAMAAVALLDRRDLAGA